MRSPASHRPFSPHTLPSLIPSLAAAGGYIPGQSSCTDISNFGNVDGYNLNMVGCDGTGLVDWLQTQGWTSTSTVSAGTVCAVFSCDHAVLGVGDGLCAAHNNARWQVDCAGYYGTPSICLNPP